MSLKTDYRNDKYVGKRKYNIEQNADGTVSLDDVTSYEEIGDIFSANDINTTNTSINENAYEITKTNEEITKTNGEVGKIKSVTYALVKLSSWSANLPYKQTISVPGLTALDSPIVGGPDMRDNPSASIAKQRNKSFGYLDRAVSGNGEITLYCYISKPISDFTIILKGV